MKQETVKAENKQLKIDVEVQKNLMAYIKKNHSSRPQAANQLTMSRKPTLYSSTDSSNMTRLIQPGILMVPFMGRPWEELDTGLTHMTLSQQ